MSDKKLSLIEKMTMNINEMTTEVLAWSNDIKVVDVEDTYWQEIKMKVYLMCAVLSLGLIFLLFGSINLVRIVGFFLIIQIIMIIIPGIKRIWKKTRSLF